MLLFVVGGRVVVGGDIISLEYGFKKPEVELQVESERPHAVVRAPEVRGTVPEAADEEADYARHHE